MKKIISFLSRLGEGLIGSVTAIKERIFRKQLEAQRQEKFKRGLLTGVVIASVAVIIILVGWFGWNKFFNKNDSQSATTPIAEAKVYVINSRKCNGQCWDTQLFIDALEQKGVKVVKQKKSYVGILPFGFGYSTVKKYDITQVPTVIVEFTGKNKPDISNFFNTGLGKVVDGKFILGKILAPYYDLTDKKIKGLVNVVYLTDATCINCYDVNKHEVALKNLGIDTEGAKAIDVASQEGKDLLAKYNITQVPTVLIMGEVNEYQVLAQAWTDVGIVASDGTYIFTNMNLMEGYYRDLKTGKEIEADPAKAVPATTATKN